MNTNNLPGGFTRLIVFRFANINVGKQEILRQQLQMEMGMLNYSENKLVLTM